jgi:hypothetical protein
MEAGHGSSSLSHSSDLEGFITILVCEPSCFDIRASLSVFSYDGKLHKRKVFLKQSDLVMVPSPNQRVETNRRQRLPLCAGHQSERADCASSSLSAVAHP